jgi:hypothetical protein
VEVFGEVVELVLGVLDVLVLVGVEVVVTGQVPRRAAGSSLHCSDAARGAAAAGTAATVAAAG